MRTTCPSWSRGALPSRMRRSTSSIRMVRAFAFGSIAMMMVPDVAPRCGPSTPVSASLRSVARECAGWSLATIDETTSWVRDSFLAGERPEGSLPPSAPIQSGQFEVVSASVTYNVLGNPEARVTVRNLSARGDRCLRRTDLRVQFLWRAGETLWLRRSLRQRNGECAHRCRSELLRALDAPRPRSRYFGNGVARAFSRGHGSNMETLTAGLGNRGLVTPGRAAPAPR